MSTQTQNRKEITNHHAVIQAIQGISAIEELVEFEDGHGFKFGVDLEVSIYGRNYGPGKKVGPYIKMYDYPAGTEIVHQGDWDTNTFFIIVEGSAEVYVAGVPDPVAVFEAGKPFGEMGVLAGVQRSATVKAHRQQGVRVLEVQRPALRVLRKLKKFGAALDLTYRNNGRNASVTKLEISEDLKKRIKDISEFKIVARGHVITGEGQPVESLIIIKDGWVKRTASSQNSETSDYIGAGYCLGINALSFKTARWPYRTTATSRTEMLEISIEEIHRDPALLKALKEAFEPAGTIGTPLQPVAELDFNPEVKKAQDRILDKGLADANNLLVMDMDLCIRCGNCSLACHEIHGQSRLTRRGIHVLRPKTPDHKKLDQSILAPAVCLHCKDPECLTGCPTGAIARFEGGQVDIIPPLCIGCSDCATQCPYNAISLIPRSDLKGPDKKKPAKDAKGGGKNGKGAPAEEIEGFNPFAALGLKFDPKPKPVTGSDDLVAIKCNLCNGTPLNPTDKATNKPVHKTQKYSCEENCPTGALKRIKPNEYFNEIAGIHGPAFRQDGTMIYGTKFGHADRGKQIMHALGIFTTLALCGLTMAGIVKYGLGTPLFQSDWFNFRWITGLVGLLGIVVVMIYPGRRQVWKRRVGPLRYWMLSHAYAGVIAGILLLLHGGTSLGGLITAALMISFDFVILTGIIGILLYWVGPRTLTKIEGEPLLIADLKRRREELYQEIADFCVTAQEAAQKSGRAADFDRTFIAGRDRVIAKLMSIPYLMRQYLRRESLDDMLADARRTFSGEIDKLATPEEKTIFANVIDAAATVRRVDALIYIHRALKLWLPPHVISTSVMLALLLIHIVQVTYYLWR
jgi:Fe-S-cluster-containing dehydrogenase component/CRP-like cAMP-binding protein